MALLIYDLILICAARFCIKCKYKKKLILDTCTTCVILRERERGERAKVHFVMKKFRNYISNMKGLNPNLKKIYNPAGHILLTNKENCIL